MLSKQNHITIKSFGGCSISAGDHVVSEDVGRSKKIWILIEYLLFSGKKTVSSDDLVALLWPEDDGPSDPSATLRLLVHRARTELARLGLGKDVQLIQFKNKAYCWNFQITSEIDIDRFSALCQQAHVGSIDQRLHTILAAIDLYQGRFLPKSAHMQWVMALDVYYHTMYISICEDAVAILKPLARHQDIIDLCKKAVAIDPYIESMHTAMIEALSALGFYKDATVYYENVTKLMREEFALPPSEELTAAYRTCIGQLQTQESDIGIIVKDLLSDVHRGAFFVEYMLFKQICNLKLREMMRSGQALQLALVSATGDFPPGDTVAISACIKEAIEHSTRQGDLFTHFSTTQFLILLQSTSYENAQLVLKRIHKKTKQPLRERNCTATCSILPLNPHQLDDEHNILADLLHS